MEITCLGSGSTGNSYIVHQEGYTYLLDAGVNIRKITSNVNLNELDFAFISHEHKDHALNLEKLENRLEHLYYGKNINDFQKMSYKAENKGKIKIYAFPIEHGKCKNAGLIVETENECLLYATDFTICKYNLKHFKFTHLMVELNYDDELMKVAEKNLKRLRQINTHMSFNGLKTFISKCINTQLLEEIILIHLSTETELIDRDIIAAKSKLEFKTKIGICKGRGGIEWYGG